MIIESRAFARAGLLGNPSDGYFGKTISIIVRNFGASVSLYESPELKIEEADVDLNTFRNIYHLVDSVKLTGYYGGTRLVKAAIKKFWEYCEDQHIKLANKNFTVRYRSSTPRQVGLAGSSAIITATMKALMKFYEVEIPKNILPTIILNAESEELGINAGLQDRVIQVFEGCVFMDFEKKHLEKNNFGKYESIDPALLPNLYLAYKIELGKVSGTVHNNLREKYDKGDKLVHDTLDEIASLAEQGHTAILNKDYETLKKLINLNFDLRCKIMNISPSNMELVMTARECGATAKFSGSGGAIIGTYEDNDMLQKLILNLRKINARVIKPIII
jgi:glucuronokinase